MSGNKFRLAAIILAMLMMVMLMPAAVMADSGGYTTERYDVNITTDANHVFHVKETIKVDFYQARHGIYRYIPEDSALYEIKHIDVENYNFDTGSEDGNTLIRIGSEDEYVRGEQTYRISYDLVGFKDLDDSADHLAIDMFPTDWGTDVDVATATLTLPEKVDNINVYEGQYQSTGNGKYFDVTQKGRTIKAESRDTLPQGVGLTVTADLPEGYWVNPKDRTKALPGVYGLMGALALLMMGLWGAVGRDQTVVKTVEFYPPDKMDPLQVAYIANDKVEGKDISALFMYFASKGYATINQHSKKEFFLERKNRPDQTEKSHVKKIYNSLFHGPFTVVSLKKLPSGFGETAAHVNEYVKDSLGKNRQAFTEKSEKARLLGIALLFLIPAIAGAEESHITGWGVIGAGFMAVWALIIAFFGRKVVRLCDSMGGKKKPVKLIVHTIIFLVLLAGMSAVIAITLKLLALICFAATALTLIATIFVRQRSNNDLYGRVLGFKEFIKTAEEDRLRDLSEENPEYFFDIMPYAYVLGMSNKWADKFANFKIPQPSWYHTTGYGYDPFFHGMMFSTSSHGIGSSMSEFYKEIAGDIGGDSGGGGGGSFSGGGFGGGGGGSW